VSSWLNDVNTSAYGILSAVAGTDAITANAPLTFTSYTRGIRFFFVSAAANTGAVTININGLGVKNVTKLSTIPLAVGDILAGTTYAIMYDGTQFQLLNSSAEAPVGECRLDYISTTSIKLSRWNGNRLFVNGINCIIPAAGVSLANTSMGANALLNIYAVATAGVITSLEFSGTAHTVDTNFGNKIKTGDPTRVLVGKVYTDAAGLFLQSASSQQVLSWFNPFFKGIATSPAAPVPTTSLVPASLISPALTCLSWATEATSIHCGFVLQNNAANAVTFANIGIDTLAQQANTVYFQSYIANAFGSGTCTYHGILSEGIHTIFATGWVNAGTATFANATTVLSARVQY
jgi:hypothetical protein